MAKAIDGGTLRDNLTDIYGNGNRLVYLNDVLDLALSTYGAQAQTMMVMEEMAELQKELCKHARGKENRAQIAEEIADVQIMLEQMELLHDCEGLVAGFKAQKLDRLEKRLREG